LVKPDGSKPTTDLIANLNVVSLDSGVYIDPEDWSPYRSRDVTPLGAGSTATLS
jgi:hypothetical protein